MAAIPDDERNALELLAHFRSAGAEDSLYSPSEQGSHFFEDDRETPFTSVGSLVGDPALDQDSTQQQQQEGFFPRVSQLSYVQPYVQAYNTRKSSSKVVQYVESSVQALSKPVLSKVVNNPNVQSLDGFACRQLDRWSPVASTSALPQSDHECRQRREGRQHDVHVNNTEDQPNQISNRSPWESILIQASGLGLAVSSESMKRLQYCLQWLSYGTESINYQISLLRSLISNLQTNPSDQMHAESLLRIKNEIFSTVQKAIEVISTYAGAALPVQARAVVRKTVLALPEKVAARQNFERGEQGLQEAAEKVLGFALEGVDVLGGVARVVGESIEKADAWLERMRAVGLAKASEDIQQQHMQMAAVSPNMESYESPVQSY